jgi:iron-sulfur cluster repair protein YtfE (RIC family)
MNGSLTLAERQGLPEALRVLADAYPRANWHGHANFGELVRFWMQRHAMFRQLIDVLHTDATQVLSAEIPFEAYRPRLSRYGGLLLNELHNHHQVEDHHYFPQLVALDARLERGFDLLESDHDAMDGLLHEMAEGANAVLQGGEAGPFLERLTGFGNLLERHLTDEEDIVVPVILDTGFKG